MPSLADVLAAQTGAPGPVYEGAQDSGVTMGNVLQAIASRFGIPTEPVRNAAGDVVFPTNALERWLPQAGEASSSIAAAVMPPGAPMRIANPIRVYHGTPNLWPAEPGFPLGRFNPEKVGSGEGAAAYGYAPGGYWAENPAVAKDYQAALSDWKYTINGKIAPEDLGTQSAIAALIRAHPTGESGFKVTPELLERAKAQDIERLGSSDPAYLKGYAGLEGATVGLERDPGHLYVADLHARPEQFLNWDAPIAQQNEALKSFINENRQAGSYIDPRTWDAVYRESPAYGSELYQAMTSGRGGMSAPEATTALREAGIPGIRYLDQFSRARAKPVMSDTDKLFMDLHEPPGGYPANPPMSSNYVVFDPNIIDILRKYAIPGMTGATMADVLAGQREQQ